MSWTEERVERLSTLWLEGRSASQIAAELGEGVSRNAVIGKVHRLGL
ncbi:MAG: GcrA cell cycle regulator, partial [Caulobacteraceae bacterium]|nr:GcrA cell cycle regulator [Caulobacter sp.]